nr:hypothetical protein [Tanacetum cinerariifolium]
MFLNNILVVKIAGLLMNCTSCEIFCQSVQKKREEKRIEKEQAAKAQSWKLPVCYDDDDDEESSNSLNDNIISELPLYSAVTPTEPIDFLKSMPNHDSSIIISSKIDSLFDEFIGELTLLKSIPPGIDETDCHPEEEIRLTKRLLYDNSSPRRPEEIISDNSNADIESFSPSPIPNKDNDDDSERDIPILEELLDNYSLSLPDNESYHFDIPSPHHPPAKPPDGITGTLNIKMMGDVSDQKLLTTCRNGLKRKRSPPMTLELFANSLNLYLPDLELPVPSSVIAVRTSAMTSL